VGHVDIVAVHLAAVEQLGDRRRRSGKAPSNAVDHAKADVLRNEFVGDIATA
jgi:hypothetical protein